MTNEYVLTIVGDDTDFDFSVDDETGLDLDFGESYVVTHSDTDPYTGEYVFTPTQETQTVLIDGLRATENITINPIPNNYGLITWDGSTLTVS